FETEAYRIRRRARSYDKVIFEPPPVAVIDHVDSGIDTRGSNFRIHRNIGAPLPWIVPEEVIRWRGVYPNLRGTDARDRQELSSSGPTPRGSMQRRLTSERNRDHGRARGTLLARRPVRDWL